MTRTLRRIAVAALAATLVATALPASALPASAQSASAQSAAGHRPSGPPLRKNTSNFRGVNWADPRDNYASDAVVPSGLSTADNYRTTYAKSSVIIGDFRSKLRANTVRLPINPASVGTAWWRSYRGAIDAAVHRGDKVILSYWESPEAKDGRVDDQQAWSRMWDTVFAEYGRNRSVYFEPMNEPFGYSLTEWVGLTSSWIERHRQTPRSRFVISGTGYNDNVTGVGAAPELKGTLLSLHFYGFWASDTTEAAWKANLEPRIGSYGWRTVIDEAGSPMTTGLDYGTHDGSHDGDVSTAYLGALTEVARERRMGIVYWPGLRTDDTYSMTTLRSNGHLSVTNRSGLAQVQWGWGLRKREPVG